MLVAEFLLLVVVVVAVDDQFRIIASVDVTSSAIVGGCHECVVIVSSEKETPGETTLSEKETPGETTNQRRRIDVYCCVLRHRSKRSVAWQPETSSIVVYFVSRKTHPHV